MVWEKCTTLRALTKCFGNVLIKALRLCCSHRLIFKGKHFHTARKYLITVFCEIWHPLRTQRLVWLGLRCECTIQNAGLVESLDFWKYVIKDNPKIPFTLNIRDPTRREIRIRYAPNGHNMITLTNSAQHTNKA